MKTKTNLETQNKDIILIQQNNVERAWCENIVKNATIMAGELRFATIPVHLLHKPRYQRESNMTRINRIAAHWDENKCGVILVSYRDEKFWFVDGQHRLEAAKIVGRTDMLCQLLTGLTEKKEFEIYQKQGENRSGVSAYDTVTGGSNMEKNPEANIIACIEKHGITYARRGQKSGGALACMGLVADIYRCDGEDALNWIFDIIQDMGWAGLPKSYHSSIIRSLDNVRRLHSGRWNISLSEARKALVSFCKNYRPDEFIAWAKISHPKAMGEVTALNMALIDIVKKSCAKNVS